MPEAPIEQETSRRVDIMCPRCGTRRMGFAVRQDGRDGLGLGDHVVEASDGLLSATCKICLRRGDACRWQVPRQGVVDELDDMARVGETRRQRRAQHLGGDLELA